MTCLKNTMVHYGAYVVLALRQLWMIKTVCGKGNLGSKIEVCKVN